MKEKYKDFYCFSDCRNPMSYSVARYTKIFLLWAMGFLMFLIQIKLLPLLEMLFKLWAYIFIIPMHQAFPVGKLASKL